MSDVRRNRRRRVTALPDTLGCAFALQRSRELALASMAQTRSGVQRKRCGFDRGLSRSSPRATFGERIHSSAKRLIHASPLRCTCGKRKSMLAYQLSVPSASVLPPVAWVRESRGEYKSILRTFRPSSIHARWKYLPD